MGGLISNLLNPEAALFFLAFFPNYIQKEALASPVPFMILGVVLCSISLVWLLVLAYFSSTLAKKFQDNQQFNFYLNKISGVIFILLAISMILP